ncbi:MAG: DUF4230 domain-containing protein [Bacteroidota bacterium]
MTDVPRRLARPLTVALVLAFIAMAAMLVAPFFVPDLSLTEEEVQQTVLSTIQSEAREEFLVTGRLRSSLSSSSTRRRWVRVLNLTIGETTVRVDLPGTMTYGLPLDALTARDVSLDGETVTVRLPDPEVFAVEPELEDARVDVQSAGLNRLSPEQAERTVQHALRSVRPQLRQQAEQYLRENDQPRVNTAETLAEMLAGPLRLAGAEVEQFRFIVAPGDTLTVVPESGTDRVRTGVDGG